MKLAQQAKYCLVLADCIFAPAQSRVFVARLWVDAIYCGSWVQTQGFAEDRGEVLQFCNMLNLDGSFPANVIDFLLGSAVGGTIFQQAV